MKYFAYGSNMSLARLRARTPSARPLGRFTLVEHSLRFHKMGMDGSGKCDAFYTGNAGDMVHGVLYEIRRSEKWRLDKAEGLGHGYDEQVVTVSGADGELHVAVTYRAIRIDAALKPYSWYRHHVLVGAWEVGLPPAYTQQLEAIECIEDEDRERDRRERAIHRITARVRE